MSNGATVSYRQLLNSSACWVDALLLVCHIGVGEIPLIQMSYKITGLKKLVSNEGYAFNANLRCGNRKVAEISDDGWGGPTNVDFVSKEAEQAFRDACHTTYRQQLKDFYFDVCEEHVEDLAIYMQRFDARDYSSPSKRNSTNGEYFISVDDPVETMATLMCEEVIYG